MGSMGSMESSYSLAVPRRDAGGSIDRMGLALKKPAVSYAPSPPLTVHDSGDGTYPIWIWAVMEQQHGRITDIGPYPIDPGSRIHDPGSWIQDPETQIQDPGSTLQLLMRGGP